MIVGLALKRRPEPEDPTAGAFAFFSLVAAAGFVFGWVAQALGTF